MSFHRSLFVPCGRKGDYYRYLAEFKAGDDHKEAADQSLRAYEVCLIQLHLLEYFFLVIFHLIL